MNVLGTHLLLELKDCNPQLLDNLGPLEVLLGLLLIRGWKLIYGAGFTTLLLGFFLTMMGISYARGVEATCGCFGLGEPVSSATLLRDTGFFLVAVFLTISAWYRKNRCLQPPGH